ncbi:hypothetical protein NliqN6_3746 [Naganishia liquefaciens]|uniref:18S rRNA factor 2 n=1 Tax=Naganishia liquefaciens TaxID=104408 RepID=A0A8H3TUL0_9TREE|nr:hypothetical protein NliqN6_3746 [Naganishia liquefaciens]
MPSDGEIAAAGQDKSLSKKRLRIPGIQDLVLPSSNPSDDPQPLRKKPKRAAKASPTPGIVYISRLPPGMTHQKVKHVLNGYGEIGRIYAQQKDAPLATANNQSRKRKHASANYSEAWVEFKDKKIAKVVAEMLNAQTIGGKKGDRWRDDIWTMKYLSGFKWEMLGEQVAYERQAHSARLRQELSKSRAEQSEYLKNVELARVLEKRKAKRQAQAGEPDASVQMAKSSASSNDKAQRVYKQKTLVDTARAVSGPDGAERRKDGRKADVMAGVLDSLF